MSKNDKKNITSAFQIFQTEIGICNFLKQQQKKWEVMFKSSFAFLANFSHTAFTQEKEEGLKKFFDVSFHTLLNAHMFLQALLKLN